MVIGDIAGDAFHEEMRRERGWTLRLLTTTFVAIFSLCFCAGAQASTGVSAGGEQACAVLPTGHVECWGQNEDGELGNGTTKNSDTPVEVQGINTATQVAAGGESDEGPYSYEGGDGYTCALLTDDHVDCWGENYAGELGNGTNNNSDTPVEVQGLSSANQVSAGTENACALLSSGHVDCWGRNSEGQLGNGTTNSSDTPVEVQGITTAIGVSAGGGHACALLANGHIDCWGGSDSLGNGTTNSSDTPVEVQGISTATEVAAAGGFVEYSHTCALLSSGHIDCWGDNANGALGTSTSTESSDTPLEVQGVTAATQVSAGGGPELEGGYTCALLSSGRADCWGNNEYGELGNGTTVESSTPVGVEDLTTATQITTGGVESCAVLTGGHVDCWGANIRGELGNGTTGSSLTPVEVQGVSIADQIEETCAVLSSGHVACWGDNYDGQLGNGTTDKSDTPVEVRSIATATQVSAEGATACALLSSDHVDCWGGNYAGQLGNGTKTNSDTPVEVQGITTATEVSAADESACALLSSGHVECWGENEEGELGNGTKSSSDTPVQVQGITTATEVSTGAGDACALLSSGHVDCWGSDVNGKLGAGVVETTDTPVEVQSITTATQVSMGWSDACALLTSGHVDCWGGGADGGLGNGKTEIAVWTPVEVENLSTATEVTARGSATCARLTSGHVDCWGDNERGELGNGTTSNADTPVEVQSISEARQVSAANGVTCALLTSGHIECWGLGEFGELGNGTVWSTVPTEVTDLSLAASPTALTETSSGVGQNTATVNATVNPQGVDVTGCVFEYGLDGRYELSVPCSPVPGDGTQPVPVSATLSGLSAGTTYSYRVSVTSAAGTRTGAAQTFTTLPRSEQKPEPHEQEHREREAREREAKEKTEREAKEKAPVLGQRETVAFSSGAVEIKGKGTSEFAPLSGAAALPNGSEVEATRGRVTITVALPDGQTQTAEVYGGRFVIEQERDGFTDFVLSLPLTGCPTTKAVKAAEAAIASHSKNSKHHSGPTSRRLWVSEHGGKWGTTGRYVSTVVEGTHWLTLDECAKSEVEVVEGKVEVHNLVTHKTKLVTAGQRYTAAGRKA